MGLSYPDVAARFWCWSRQALKFLRQRGTYSNRLSLFCPRGGQRPEALQKHMRSKARLGDASCSTINRGPRQGHELDWKATKTHTHSPIPMPGLQELVWFPLRFLARLGSPTHARRHDARTANPATPCALPSVLARMRASAWGMRLGTSSPRICQPGGLPGTRRQAATSLPLGKEASSPLRRKASKFGTPRQIRLINRSSYPESI